jgi:chemotaxis protein methyltransferase CheR
MTEFNIVESQGRSGDLAVLSPASFTLFARFITSELGIKMPDSKLTLVQSRLLRRVLDLRMESLEQYAEYFFASSSSEEREHFINAITTNKTDFFREPQHFAFLRDVVLPTDRAAARRRVRFKAWSAGCSSGEEPYTLAMVLAQYAEHSPGFDFAILGTDISTRVLSSARGGIYQESQILPVPPEFRRKYLRRGGDKAERLARVVPELRRKVSLHQLNLMVDDYCIKDVFDIVFFRNVMIYFDKNTQEAVINKICRNLAPGGYLFVGHSESLAGLDIPVRQVQTAIYCKPA